MKQEMILKPLREGQPAASHITTRVKTLTWRKPVTRGVMRFSNECMGATSKTPPKFKRTKMEGYNVPMKEPLEQLLETTKKMHTICGYVVPTLIMMKEGLPIGFGELNFSSPEAKAESIKLSSFHVADAGADMIVLLFSSVMLEVAIPESLKERVAKSADMPRELKLAVDEVFGKDGSKARIENRHTYLIVLGVSEVKDIVGLVPYSKNLQNVIVHGETRWLDGGGDGVAVSGGMTKIYRDAIRRARVAPLN